MSTRLSSWTRISRPPGRCGQPYLRPWLMQLHGHRTRISPSPEDAEQAIALDPRLAAGYLLLANVRLQDDFDWEGAEAALDKAAALQPGSVELLFSRADLEDVRGRLDEAIELRRRTVALDPLCFLHVMYSWESIFTRLDSTTKPTRYCRRPWTWTPGYVHWVRGQDLTGARAPARSPGGNAAGEQRGLEVDWGGNRLSLPGPSTGFGSRIERTHRQPW